MAYGIVKDFNVALGYGFIIPDGHGGDVIFHVSRIEENGWVPREGERVSYELGSHPQTNEPRGEHVRPKKES